VRGTGTSARAAPGVARASARATPIVLAARFAPAGAGSLSSKGFGQV
jgi:hypothetical protein